MKRQIAAGEWDQFTNPEAESAVKRQRLGERLNDIGSGLRRRIQAEWRESGSRMQDEKNRSSPGWDDPAAYAAQRRGEVAEIQRINDESIGMYQDRLARNIASGQDKAVRLRGMEHIELLPEGKDKENLVESIKRFGKRYNLSEEEAAKVATDRAKQLQTDSENALTVKDIQSALSEMDILYPSGPPKSGDKLLTPKSRKNLGLDRRWNASKLY